MGRSHIFNQRIFNFKWSDNMQNDGDVAPSGRFTCRNNYDCSTGLSLINEKKEQYTYDNFIGCIGPNIKSMRQIKYNMVHERR